MTRKSLPNIRRAAAPIVVLLIAVALSGCFNPFNPLVAPNRVAASEPPPYPSRADLVVRLFEWCWDHRAIAEYEEIFTEDFLFAFAATDSAGRAFQGGVLTRTDEIETARHLFVGGGTSPPANSVTLQLDQNLIAQQDTRPGKQDTTYHQEIITSVVLRIETDEEDFEVTGAARFFLVRGDSALIPEELVARGFHPDPGRWYIERWEDETVGSAGNAFSAVRDRRGASLAARPSGLRRPAPGPDRASDLLLPVSWGFIKGVYFPPR